MNFGHLFLDVLFAITLRRHVVSRVSAVSSIPLQS